MRPDQKIILSCRQTGERAERLLEWLEQSRTTLKAQDRALRAEVHAIAAELLSLVDAIDQPPAAGIIGGWSSPRAELVGALMTDAAPSTPDEEGRLTLTRDRVLSLLPRDSDGGTTTRIRLVAVDRNDGPYRFPIRIGLLGQLDVAGILAAGYLAHVPPARQVRPDAEALCNRLGELAQEIVPQTFSGLSRRDIDTLRDLLHGSAPDRPELRELEAAGYWETLGGMIAHLPETARRRALALLWGEDPALSKLFDRLSDSIEALGFSGETFAAFDAIMGRDPATSWIVRHADSIAATATVAACASQPTKTVRVSSRHGRAADVERFLLSALAAEIRLPIDRARLPLLETADLLLLPAPAPLMLWPDLTRPGTGPGRGRLSADEALEVFLAQKGVHLFGQSVRANAITSLLIATDLADQQSATIDAAATRHIADWIELTHGDTPHARERRRTGVALLVADHAAAGKLASEQDGRITDSIVAAFDGQRQWVEEWTPGRPFRNIFTWRPATRAPAMSEPIAGKAGSADILPFDRARSSDALSSSADLAASYDLANLQHAIAQATTGAIRSQQLSQRLVDLRRMLTERFLRLHSASDPTTVVDWRRQMGHVASNRIQQSAQAGGFGALQRTLLFTEGEAQAVLARLVAEQRLRKGSAAADLKQLDPGRLVGETFEAWITSMRQGVRSSSLMRDVHISASVIAHVIDELVLGAIRIGLQDKLAEAVRRIQQKAERSADCTYPIAALLARGINAYLETLDPTARMFRSHLHRTARITSSASAQMPPATMLADRWSETFADLIEANILGASLLGSSGQLNRELGEVLSQISATSLEGLQ